MMGGRIGSILKMTWDTFKLLPDGRYYIDFFEEKQNKTVAKTIPKKFYDEYRKFYDSTARDRKSFFGEEEEEGSQDNYLFVGLTYPQLAYSFKKLPYSNQAPGHRIFNKNFVMKAMRDAWLKFYNDSPQALRLIETSKIAGHSSIAVTESYVKNVFDCDTFDVLFRMVEEAQKSFAAEMQKDAKD